MAAKTDNPEPEQEARPAVTEYRVEQFEDMGFTHLEAAKLADAKDAKGILVRPDAVQTVLDQGCHPRLALRIFT
jgi:hypothetical protein